MHAVSAYSFQAEGLLSLGHFPGRKVFEYYNNKHRRHTEALKSIPITHVVSAMHFTLEYSFGKDSTSKPAF